MDKLPKVGDRVKVDLTDLYIGICCKCGETTLMVPRGSCAHCHASESSIVQQPFKPGETITVQLPEDSDV